MGKAIDKQFELQEKITKLNNTYRKGPSIVDDSFYDFLVDKYIELFGDDDITDPRYNKEAVWHLIKPAFGLYCEDVEEKERIENRKKEIERNEII